MDKYRQLIAWQRCRELVVVVYKVTETFPRGEQFGLVQQLRRAAVSAIANIAEGYARFGRAEFAHHLSVVLGTLAEVGALLDVSHELGFLTANDREHVEAVRSEASRVTYGLQRKTRGIAA